jgi:hypothetical protein
VLAPLDIIGGTCSPLIVFILPALIFRKMDRDGPLVTPEFLRKKQLAGGMLVLGIVLIPVCTRARLFAVIWFSSWWLQCTR